MKAIETVWKGYRFRSRLEARWAVFFDTLGLPFEYEPEGFELAGVGRYLPDFWFPTLEMWGEVKPMPLTPAELAKARALANESGREVLKLIGPPRFTVYWSVCPDPAGGYRDFMAPGDPHFGEMDYLLDDQYIHDEYRWFAAPALEDGADAGESYWLSERARAAYEAATQARFEHGEQPGRMRGVIPNDGIETDISRRIQRALGEGLNRPADVAAHLNISQDMARRALFHLKNGSES